MSVEIISIDEANKWNKTLGLFSLRDIYHTWSYHNLSNMTNEGSPLLIKYSFGKYHAAIPLILRKINNVDGLEGEDGYDATSVYGYPGVLTNITYESEDSNEFTRQFRCAFYETLNSLNCVSFFSRTNPLINSDWLLDDGKNVLKIGTTVAIDLTKSENEQVKCMSKGHRYEIRKSLKSGVVTEENADFSELNTFIEMYYQTMKRTKAANYYFFNRQYFNNLKSAFGDKLRLFFAKKNDRPLSGAMFFFSGDIIQYHLSGAFDEYVGSGGSKVIIDDVRQIGHRCGASWLHLGGGVGGGSDNLSIFKRGFSKKRLPFKVFRVILQEERYETLTQKHLKSLGKSAIINNFFPAYRAPNASDT